MKNGIISLGEALIDFIPLDQENISYQKSPGGAPANVAVGLARLGAKSTFLGKVGKDVLGEFLKETLENYGVRTNQMFLTPDIKTGVVFVTNAEDGERSFDFYIDPSADRFLEAGEIEETDFTEHKILHFGSISMISSPSKEATHYAVKLAKENGMIVSYDPNLRLGLWDNEENARETIKSMLGKADFLKISEEELEFITGEKDLDAGAEKMKAYNIPLIIITMGAEGCHVYTKDGHKHVPAMKVKAVDTTGAGDAFVSGMLYRLNEYEGDISSLTAEQAGEMATFAAVSGALAASTKGAMTALPTLDEVKKHLKTSGDCPPVL
ncbi:aminoimidazole riboside kinase [Bacillus salacetis]|uniref:aminoimidazole riboside kinase n=1 Tax=Bacillus salacetis TaxID=2315464 RepID=UPI003B9F6A86